VNVNIAERLIEQAQYLHNLQSQPGVSKPPVPRHRMEVWIPDPRNPKKVEYLACPYASDQPYDKDIVRRYAGLLDELAKNEHASEMVDQALRSYVHRVWHHRDRVIFHNLNAAEEAENYVAFLRKLDINLKNIGWYSFDKSVRSPHCVAWRERLRLEDYTIKILPPTNSDAEGSRSWFGIMPEFKFIDPDTKKEKYPNIESPGAYGFRFLMVMAFIKFGRR
jgi:hypothetical protein